MNAAFAGTPDIIDTYAKLIQNTVNYGKDDGIKLCGVYCGNIEDTTNLAIKFNTKVYMSLDNLINECEIIFICYDDKGLGAFADILKKKRVRGKILCHFNPRSDSSVISAGVTNTCYAISYPYPPVFTEESKQPKCFDISGFPVIFEGGGKKHAEFEALIKRAFPKAQLVTQEVRRLSYLTSRVLEEYLRMITNTAKSLYKISGLYDRTLFSGFCRDIMAEITSDDKDKIAEKLTENEVRTDIKLLADTGCPDIPYIYKTMEALITESGIYSDDEREAILKILKKKIE